MFFVATAVADAHDSVKAAAYYVTRVEGGRGTVREVIDCDGVLTDGRLYFSERGEELKVFHARDGQGIVDWHKAGFASGIISGRGAREIIEARAAELGIKYVVTSSVDKVVDFRKILADAEISPENV